MEKDNTINTLEKIDLSDNSGNGHERHKKGRGERKINRNNILNVIRDEAPISIFKLRDKLNIGYSTLWDVIKGFEFVGLIETKIILNDDNREEKIVSIPKLTRDLDTPNSNGIDSSNDSPKNWRGGN